jgi:hypothetical protein
MPLQKWGSYRALLAGVRNAHVVYRIRGFQIASLNNRRGKLSSHDSMDCCGLVKSPTLAVEIYKNISVGRSNPNKLAYQNPDAI